jgi:hypothetical protein
MPSRSGVTRTVGRPVERDDLRLRDAAVEVVNGGPGRGRELAVDSPDEAVDLFTVLAVRLDLLSRGHGHLDQTDLATELGMALEHGLERQEPVRDALGVVEAVDAHEELGTLPPVLADQNPHLVRLHLRGELRGVDAHREDPESNVSVAPADPIDLGACAREAEN